MFRIIALLLCAASTAADYVVDWRVPQANDANANVPRGKHSTPVKRFAADEHTYVEVVDAAGGSPKSVITQSRAVSAFSGPFTGISFRPCKCTFSRTRAAP